MSEDQLPPLREVIARHGLAAKKALGQNFLFDLNLTRRIARAAAPLDGGTVLKHAVGMSEETFFNIARWSMLVLLIAINIPPVRQLLGLAMGLVSWPFASLFQAIAG